MSVEKLILKDHPIEIEVAESNIKGCIRIKVKNENAVLAVVVLDRNQADMLRLYLTEHLK